MTIEDDNSIGKRVRRYREARGWSQKELSEKTGLSQSGISKIETDELTPAMDTLQKIADVLGVGLNELITLETSSELETTVLIDLTKIFVERKEYHHALEHIAELEKRGDLLEHQKREMIITKAESLMRSKRTDEAIRLLSELRNSLEKTHSVDTHIVAEVFNKLGNAYYLASNYGQAHAHYVRANQVALTFDVFDELAAKITYNLFKVCKWLKLPVEATEHLEKAEQYFRSFSDDRELADILFAQGLCYRDLNKLELAEKYLNDAFALYKSQILVELAQRVLYNLASSVTVVYKFELGIEHLLECAENFKNLKLPAQVAFTYIRIAELHLEKGHDQEADQYLVEAMQAVQSVEIPAYYVDEIYAFYYKMLAKTLFKKRQYTEAIEMSFNSSALFGKMSMKRDEADSLEIAVDSYHELGDSNEAMKLSKRVIELLRHSLDSNPYSEVIL